jgi:hypothetical protein
MERPLSDRLRAVARRSGSDDDAELLGAKTHSTHQRTIDVRLGKQ